MPGLRLYYTNFLYLIDFSQKQSYNRIMNHIYYFYGEESRSHDFLFYVLNRYYGIAASEKDLKKSPCGKLYLEGSAIHFNLSHSKDVVALAVGNSPVGLDVEKLRDKNFSKVANVYFGNSATDAESFFALWTKAESFVKYRAGALLTDLKKSGSKAKSSSTTETPQTRRPRR